MNALQEIASQMQQPLCANGSRRPKYERLYNQFVAVIENGGWKPGERLPTEVELANSIPVSLGTIQKALRMLADHGVVIRRHGNGTFVTGALTTSSKIKNFRFLDDDGETMLPVYSKMLAVRRKRAAKPWAPFFPGVDRFVYITRLFNVNLEFNAFAEALLPEERFGKFLKMSSQELDGSALTHMLGEQFNAPALNITHRLGQIALPEKVCTAIDVAAGTAGIEWEVVGRSYRDEAIFYQRFYLPPTDRKLEIVPL